MTDATFREYIQRQRSCLSGKFSEWISELGEWRNPACHVRRAGDSGTGFKAPYACVPMTNPEHAYQHQHGELAVIQKYNPAVARTVKTEWQAKAWFDKQVENYRVAYLKATGDKGVLEFIRDPQLTGKS